MTSYTCMTSLSFPKLVCETQTNYLLQMGENYLRKEQGSKTPRGSMVELGLAARVPLHLGLQTQSPEGTMNLAGRL